MLAFRLARHLRWHRWMNTVPRHSNTWYRRVLCIIITLAYRLYSFWLLIKMNNNNNNNNNSNNRMLQAVFPSYCTSLRYHLVQPCTRRWVRSNLSVEVSKVLEGSIDTTGLHDGGHSGTRRQEILLPSATPLPLQQETKWEHNSLSDRQITYILWNPTVHYRVHNSLSFVSISA